MRRPYTPSVAAGRRARGMTLMEMMVAIAILAGMVLAFNMILSQSQRVVTKTQRQIRANAAAMAISQVIRRDVQSISKNGFLHVGNNGEAMIFTTAGVAESVTGNAESNGALVCYRLADNAATEPAMGSKDVLCRIGLVLSKDASATSPTWTADGDRWPDDPADIQRYLTAGSFPTQLTDIVNKQLTVQLPPKNPSDVLGLWKVLTYNVTNLSIQWGRRNTGTGGIDWQNTSSTWTYRSQDTWPDALKIKFSMNATAIERRALEGSATYEVICPVAK